MTWLYNGQEVTEIDEKYIGFVYQITNVISGRSYIGKKLSKKSKTKQVKGKKKKIKVASDWQTYWSSCEELKEDIEKLGQENFKREILYFCLSKGMCSYIEAKLQFKYEVLEHPEKWYNRYIQVRVHPNHLKFEELNQGTSDTLKEMQQNEQCDQPDAKN